MPAAESEDDVKRFQHVTTALIPALALAACVAGVSSVCAQTAPQPGVVIRPPAPKGTPRALNIPDQTPDEVLASSPDAVERLRKFEEEYYKIKVIPRAEWDALDRQPD